MTDAHDTDEQAPAPMRGVDQSSDSRVTDLSFQVEFLDRQVAKYRALLEADASGPAQASEQRAADLTTQIDFLDGEIARYRALVEKERIRHATDMADLQLAADSRLDDMRREERIQTQALHDSYRNLLNERQIENEQALSKMATAHAAELASERARSEAFLDQEIARSKTSADASSRQTLDELNESHVQSQVKLRSELRQATETVGRLERELAEYVERARLAEIQVHDYDTEVTKLRRRLDELDSHNDAQLKATETRLAVAEKRLQAERRRSAATLAELLERSAAIAAEADSARSLFATERSDAEQAAIAELKQAHNDYASLAAAADERASRALLREADLEAAIAELRNDVPRNLS